MSMSQEEIEALMNGLDISEDESSEVATEAEDLDAIVNEAEPVAETAPEVEEPSVEEPIVEEPASVDETAAESSEEVEEPVVEVAPDVEDVPVTDASIDDLINSLEEETPELEADVQAEDIDELLATIDDAPEGENEEVDSSDIDDLIASLDNVGDDNVAETIDAIEEPVVAPVVEKVPERRASDYEARNSVEEKINQGVFPLPADDESKVVTQLTAVAEDSEEKATQIFDVLSYILDENMAIDGSVNKISKFMDEQEKVLQTLTAKFPNVDVFSSNLEMLNELKEEPKKIKDILNNENNELFSAMELMQYHDINRQKIERVMSVIRKLSTYLNNIFEDDNSHKEIVVAKHISGDKNDELVGDADLDALIAEFGN